MKNLFHKQLFVYTINTYIGVSAYEVYQGLLSTYFFALGWLGFTLIRVVTLKKIYIPFERQFSSLGINLMEVEPPLSIKVAFKKNGYLLACSGILSSLGFILMLPNLGTGSKALLFIVFFALSGLVKVLFGFLIFKDPIQNVKMYTIGIMIALLGGIAYQFNFKQQNIDKYLFLTASLKLLIEVVNSFIVRKITDKSIAKDKHVNVTTQNLVTSYFEIGIASLITAYYVFFVIELRYIPTFKETVGIFWIGIVVTLSGNIAGRLTNILKYTATQPIQCTRPLIGLIILYCLGTPMSVWEWGYKTICVISVGIGAWICIQYGKPMPKLQRDDALKSTKKNSVSV